MKLETPSKIALTEYVLAPWHLRVRWWLEAGLWWLCERFTVPVESSPEQANPFWRRW